MTACGETGGLADKLKMANQKEYQMHAVSINDTTYRVKKIVKNRQLIR